MLTAQAKPIPLTRFDSSRECPSNITAPSSSATPRPRLNLLTFTPLSSASSTLKPPPILPFHLTQDPVHPQELPKSVTQTSTVKPRHYRHLRVDSAPETARPIHSTPLPGSPEDRVRDSRDEDEQDGRVEVGLYGGIDEVEVEWCVLCKRDQKRERMELREMGEWGVQWVCRIACERVVAAEGQQD